MTTRSDRQARGLRHHSRGHHPRRHRLRARGLAGALVFGAWLAGPALAAPAPRLDFTREQLALADAVAGNPGLAAFYGANGLAPVFTGPDAAGRRQALIAAVARAPAHGLPSARYRPAELQATDARGASAGADEVAFARAFAAWAHDVEGGVVDPRKLGPSNHRTVRRSDLDDVLARFVAAPDPRAVLAGIEPRDPRYLALQAALADQSRLLAPPGTVKVPPGLWKPGSSGPEVAALRTRLASIGFRTDGGDLYDEPLAQAVRAYQERAGLGPDGVAGPRTVELLNRGAGPRTRALLMALERMRWMNGHDLSARHVWVNLPEFNARIVDHGRTEFETRVVVGKTDADMQTPEFSDQMEHLVVNPRWNVPRSIAVREYLPRLQKNRNAVSHLDVVDRAGRVVPRGDIDFGRYTPASFPYRLQQKPGEDNALGEVKFIFPNPWNIYLHDTPSKHLFGESRRAFSHGCVRVARPMELAQALLTGQVENPAATYSRAVASGKETWLALKPNLPVHLVYFTTFPDEDGRIRSHPDIYDRDGALWQALVKAGVESGDGDG